MYILYKTEMSADLYHT